MRRRFVTPLLVAGLAMMGGAAHADTFDKAVDAWRHGNSALLAKLAPKLASHPLGIYVQFWRLAVDLKQDDPHAVQQFLKEHPDTLLAQRLRSMWLRKLGRDADWQDFQTLYPELETPDAELTCMEANANLHDQPQGAGGDALELWRNGHDESPGCLALFDQLAGKTLTDEMIWARLSRQLDEGQFDAVRTLAHRYLPGAASTLDQLTGAISRPQHALERQDVNWQDRAQREVLMVALLARYDSDPTGVFHLWQGWQSHFTPAEQSRMWARLATTAARRHEPQALDWFAKAQGPWRTEQLAWEARAALRAGRWPVVVQAIRTMPASEAQRSVWRYWMARALAAGGDALGARTRYQEIAGSADFYGQLAAEALGQPVWLPAKSKPATAAEMHRVGHEPGVVLTADLIEHGLRGEALKQWLFALRHADDRTLLAAATLAEDRGWYDLAIRAADQTQDEDNLALRYPMHYRNIVVAAAEHHHLDPAWLFGLIRQESRFMEDARSGAHASGLMQLMPQTATWIAQKLGIKTAFKRFDSSLNVKVGAWYLDYIQSRSGDPVLTTAAYNAGLSRARHWQGDSAMEAAVYIESIPFSETRDYVEKVMANATYYAIELGRPLPGLKERLGQVPPRPQS